MNVSISENKVHFGNQFKEMLIANQKLEKASDLSLNELNRLKDELAHKNKELSEIRNKLKVDVGNQT